MRVRTIDAGYVNGTGYTQLYTLGLIFLVAGTGLLVRNPCNCVILRQIPMDLVLAALVTDSNIFWYPTDCCGGMKNARVW